jgi:hypothetical protein
MTKYKLRYNTIGVMAFYVLMVFLGILLRIRDVYPTNTWYETFKDLIPFIFAVPAAYLGYCFQQRGSYLVTLRSLWSKLVAGVNQAVVYTFDPEPTREKFDKACLDLRIVIDELRGVYSNIGEGRNKIGLYPYEPVKQIYNALRQLGYSETDENKRDLVRLEIENDWKSIRQDFLAEFDRSVPEHAVSHYLKQRQRP